MLNKISPRNGYSEVRPFDDYRELYGGFLNKTNERTEQNTEKWVEDTHKLAKRSFYLYCLEAPLKFVRHFIERSDYKNSIIANFVYSGERLFGISGDIFRNLIYGHKDSDGSRDDNLGAQKFEDEKIGNNLLLSVGKANYYSQTGGKLALIGIGLFNAELANDLEWAVANTLDRWWWRGMGTNLSFGSDFAQKIWNTVAGSIIKNKQFSDKDKVNWKFIKEKFGEHFNNAKTAFKKYQGSAKAKSGQHLLDFCGHMDKFVSCFSPLANFLTMAGSALRPFARRFEWASGLRDTIRTLSVIDKPLVWLNNIFRFYIPEKIVYKNKDPFENKSSLFGFFSTPDLLLASTVGSMADFVSILFESTIKERSGNIEHLVDLSRGLTRNFEEWYFSLRRTYAKRDIELEKKQGIYDQLQNSSSVKN